MKVKLQNKFKNKEANQFPQKPKSTTKVRTKSTQSSSPKISEVIGLCQFNVPNMLEKCKILFFVENRSTAKRLMQKFSLEF